MEKDNEIRALIKEQELLKARIKTKNAMCEDLRKQICGLNYIKDMQMLPGRKKSDLESKRMALILGHKN